MEIPKDLSAYLQIVEEGGVKHIACRRCNRLFFSVKDAARHLAEMHGIKIAAQFYEGR
ncbi:MAG: hypothetical protein ABWJ97_00755 [Thermoproteus sp.]